MNPHSLFSKFSCVGTQNLIPTKILTFNHLYLNPPFNNPATFATGTSKDPDFEELSESPMKLFHTIILNTPFPSSNPKSFDDLFKISSVGSGTKKTRIGRKKHFKSGLMKSIFSNSDKIICADGGANRLLGFSKQIIPDVVCGDFDSVHPETLQHYAQYSKFAGKFSFRGKDAMSAAEFKKNLIIGAQNAFEAEKQSEKTEFEKTIERNVEKLSRSGKNQFCEFQSLSFDQDTNDLEKCLNLVTKRYSFGSKIDDILIYGGGGRLDQEMANLSSLLKFQMQIPEKNFFLVSQFSSSIFLLPNNKYKFSVLLNNLEKENLENSKKKRFFSFAKNSCGIIPFNNYGKANVRMKGFKWNLEFPVCGKDEESEKYCVCEVKKHPEKRYNMELGKFVSSSNKYEIRESEILRANKENRPFVRVNVEIEALEPVLFIQNHVI